LASIVALIAAGPVIVAGPDRLVLDPTTVLFLLPYLLLLDLSATLVLLLPDCLLLIRLPLDPATVLFPGPTSPPISPITSTS
jgi:hypothetical protein